MEYKRYDERRIKYVKKRDEYNAYLKEAEVVEKKWSIDILAYIFPTKEEKETVKRVPKRPHNPDVPSKYPGPYPIPATSP